MSAYSSEVDIVNSALIKVGEETISSLDDSSRQAVAAKREYPLMRDGLIRSYRWNFAVERVSLAPDGTAPPFGFENRFRLPTDCLAVIGLYDADASSATRLDRNYTGNDEPWKVEGRFIHADGTELKIFYLKQVTNVGDFDPLFAECLSWRLAADLAYFLSTGLQQAQRAEEGFFRALRQARIADAFEGTPEVVFASDWLDARSHRSTAFRPGPILDF